MARPLGSTNLPKIRDYLGQDRIDKLTEKAYKMAMEKDDSVLMKFMLEQIYGKAPQPVTGPDGGGVELKPLLVEFVNGKQDSDTNRVQETV